MIRAASDRFGQRLWLFGKSPGGQPENGASGAPDWTQVRPPEIARALERIGALPSGGWLVLDSSRRITARPASYWVAGQEIVAWREDSGPRAAPGSCPHMGAPLAAGHLRQGKLVCPWHGLELGDQPHGAWAPLAAHDDGVLTWVRPGPEEPRTPLPVLPPRPARYLEGTMRLVARCAPEDVVANRMDPWHGAHFHPHTFARLRVLGVVNDVYTVRVAFRVLGPLCVEVDCTFHCPEPHTIVMTIVAGEGVGSVVETHATPMGAGMTAIVETTLATSERLGFALARLATPLVRPLVERTARRLWREDAAYAERTRALRQGGGPDPRDLEPGCGCHQ